MTYTQLFPSTKKELQELFSSSLKGFSQVLLMNNALSGLLIFIGITIYSPILGSMTFLSSIIGNVTAKYLKADENTIKDGIYSFNSVLCSITPILFLSGYKRWLIAILAAILAAIFMKRLTVLFDRWQMPILTVPFIFLTWVGLSIAYRTDTIHIDPEFITSSPQTWNIPTEGTPTLIIGMLKGIGEVFVIDSLIASIFILLALFIAGWRFGALAIAGAFVSWLTAYFIGVDVQSLNLGLYNYNAVLTGIAVGLVFNNKDRTTLFMALVAAMLTVPVTAAVELLLEPAGLPALTFPFILCTWLFIVIRKVYPNI